MFVFKNIAESWNCNVAMKYFAIFDENVATIFQLQWNIGNIPDIFCNILCYMGGQVMAWINEKFLKIPALNLN